MRAREASFRHADARADPARKHRRAKSPARLQPGDRARRAALVATRRRRPIGPSLGGSYFAALPVIRAVVGKRRGDAKKAKDAKKAERADKTEA